MEPSRSKNVDWHHVAVSGACGIGSFFAKHGLEAVVKKELKDDPHFKVGACITLVVGSALISGFVNEAKGKNVAQGVFLGGLFALAGFLFHEWLFYEKHEEKEQSETTLRLTG